jgi:tetratricopeptide (TPR) repeat protein
MFWGVFMKTLKSLLVLAMVLVIGFCLTGCKSDDYEAALSLYYGGDYTAAVSAFKELGDYKEATKFAEEAQKALDYEAAVSLYADGDYAAAVTAFLELGSYKDSNDRAIIAQANLEEEQQFFKDVNEKLAEIEEFASSHEITDNSPALFLSSLPEWYDSYDLYKVLITKDNPETNAIAERFKNAMIFIEEMRFYVTFEQNEDLDSLKYIISDMKSIGLNDKADELNEKLQYFYFYNKTESYESYSWNSMIKIDEISIFPDSEVKTTTEQSLSIWKTKNDGKLTPEGVALALSLSDELKNLADSLQDMEQPDYYLKNCLMALGKDFKRFDLYYYDQCSDSMKDNITPELEAYYAKTTSGKAPIEITGDYLYIIPFKYHGFSASGLTSMIYKTGSQFNMYYASKPEEARYLITFSGTASPYGVYQYSGSSRTTQAYKVNISIYLKDCKTGNILHTQNISADAPYSIEVGDIPSEYYAEARWGDDDIEKLIAVLKPTLGIE